MSADDQLDPAALERLQRLGGDGFVGRIVGAFLREAPARLETARAALGKQDAEALGGAGHALISSAGNLGANGLVELGRNIERAANLGHWDILPGMVTRLEQAFASVRAQLERMVKASQ
jgi:HPt (histidine-containing phosphotransfer) domain-containing protein